MKTKLFFAFLFVMFSFTAVSAQSQIVKTGDKAPDFILNDQNGKEVKLSAVAKKSNVVLVFYRGWW